MQDSSNPPRLGNEEDFTQETVSTRNRFASEATGVNLSVLNNAQDFSAYRGNVENPFGIIQVPVGLAGPLRIGGHHAEGDYYIPLATTEGSLVASYNRGMKAITQSGGARAEVTKNEIFSSATFLTKTPEAARSLQDWIGHSQSKLHELTRSTTKHGKYLRSECEIYGSRLLVNLFYDPADAMGINMITNASHAICSMISQHCGADFYLPSAFQGDKKASFYSFHRGRGKSVLAEVAISDDIIEDTLKSSAQSIYHYYLNNIETAHLVGGYGFNMHIANGIMALSLATGQDPAYVGESANAHLIIEQRDDGLLFSVRIPSLYVGTVGGGTGLPTAKPCLEMMGCTGESASLKLAEIFAATCLAGEISVIAAIASQQFVIAHNTLGRNRPIDAD